MCRLPQWDNTLSIFDTAPQLPRTPDSFACCKLRANTGRLARWKSPGPWLDEIQRHTRGNDFLVIGFVEKQLHGLAAVLTIVHGEFVNVHADEPIGFLQIETP